jgi:hypothetical protein
MTVIIRRLEQNAREVGLDLAYVAELRAAAVSDDVYSFFHALDGILQALREKRAEISTRAA